MNEKRKELFKEMLDVIKDARRTMWTYGTSNMGFAIERCDSVIEKVKNLEKKKGEK